MASTEIVTELDEELRACKEALQDQAQEMLSLLLQFEARLKHRLDLAEARIAAMQSTAVGRRS